MWRTNGQKTKKEGNFLWNSQGRRVLNPTMILMQKKALENGERNHNFTQCNSTTFLGVKVGF